MLQVLHIFKKDIRHLRLEIILFLVLTALYAFAGLHWRDHLATRALLVVSAVILIARLIHAESIPGDNQFWISRPYRWRSLLAEKFLFLLVVINFPIFVARLIILLSANFPLSAVLPGLLWSQTLMTFVAFLPIAALATLTTGMVSFVFSMFVILAAGVGMTELMLPPSIPALRTMIDSGVQWQWDAFAALAMCTASIAIVWSQYHRRKTRPNRVFAVAAALLTAAAYLYIPLPFALALQTQMSGHNFDSSSIHIQLIARDQRNSFASGKLPEGVGLDFPIKISGIAAGIEIQPEALMATLQDAHGWSWKSSPYQLVDLTKQPSQSAGPVYQAILTIPRESFNAERDQNVTLRGSIYLTLYGNTRSKTVPLPTKPVNVMDDFQCAVGPMGDVACSAPLRWPRRQVFAKSEDPYLGPFPYPISFSPFPASLSLDNFEMD